MILNDPSTSDVYAALSADVAPTRSRIGRRAFLQAAAAAGTAMALPLALFEEAGAEIVPLGSQDGVLVLISMAGGNDGLQTLAPVTDSAYLQRRGALAWTPDSARLVSDSRGLHPDLPFVHQLWSEGRVAAIEGVGDPGADLSHFAATARWMAATGGSGRPGDTGWIGRYLDGLPNGAGRFHGVNIGRRLPLLMRSRIAEATALPTSPQGMFDPSSANDVERRRFDAMRRFAAGSSGGLQTMVAESVVEAMDVGSELGGVYHSELPAGSLEAQLVLAARLINADLGLRVINVTYGDFDGHADLLPLHADRMAELDRGLRLFYETLASSRVDRTLLLSTSEFGRRLSANKSGGTDHGRASTLFAIGSSVVGGLHGEHPDLTSVPSWESPRPTVDFRSVYATVLERWLGADSGEIIGDRHEILGFLGSPGANEEPTTGGGTVPTTTTPIPQVTDASTPDTGSADVDAAAAPAVIPFTAPTESDTAHKRRPQTKTLRAKVLRLHLATRGTLPDEEEIAFWLDALHSGTTRAEIADELLASSRDVDHVDSEEDFVADMYRNVLGRPADSPGLAFWSGRLRTGATRGSVVAAFSESPEFVQKTAGNVEDSANRSPVALLYQAYFDRTPDQSGLAFWLDTGLPIGVVSESFERSPEFQAMSGSLDDQTFIRAAYRNILGRNPDRDGERFWLDRLTAGLRRSDLMVQFSSSAELAARAS